MISEHAHNEQETLRLDGKAASQAELELARRTVALLEGIVPSLLDDTRAAQALHDVAQLKLHPLDDAQGALESVRAAFARHPSLHVARAYRKAALRAGAVADQLLALEAEARAATQPRYRASLESERGALLEAGGNAQAARQCYATAAELDPTDLTALLSLLRLALRENDAEAALAGVKRIAETSSDPAVKGEYLAWAARLDEAAGRREAALAHAAQAEVHAPDSPSVRFVLERLYAAGNQARELCRLLEAEIADGAVPSLPAWLEIGLLQRYHLDDAAAAERAFEKLADKAQGPTRLVALGELADLWARKGEWPRVVAAEEELVAAEEDARARAVGWTRIGLLREDKLDDRAGAAEAYTRAIEAVPGYVPALEGAGRVFAGNVERLLWMHKKEAEHAASPVEKATALRRAGELCLGDPGRLAEGATLLQEALHAAPGHPGIFASLERALRGQKDFARLAALYEQELSGDLEVGRRAALLVALGELAHDRLGDDDKAIGAFRAAAAIPVGVPHHALTRLVQLYEHKGELRELEAVLAQLAQLTEDPAQLASLYERVAQLEEARGDLDAAVATYRRALDPVPTTHSIVVAAGRAFARAGQWNDVLLVYERQMKDGTPTERANAGYRSGVVLARKLGRVDDGIARLEAVRAEAPDHLPTLAALAALYQEAQRWNELQPILDALPVTPHVRARRASIADVAGRRDEAAAAWQACVDAGVAASSCRARVQAQCGRWDALAEAYRATEPNGAGARASAHASYRAAELRRDRLGERERAVELLGLGLAADGESLPLMLALYHAADDPALLADVIEKLVPRLRDPAFRAALLAQRAQLEGVSASEALAARRSQLTLQPLDPVIMVRIEQVLEQRHDREAGAALLRDLGHDPKADPSLAAAAAARLGMLAEELGHLREAADHYEAALRGGTPTFLAWLGLPRLYAALGDEARLQTSLAELAEALPPGAERAAVLRRLASRQHLRGDREEAARTLETALVASPLDFDALRALGARCGNHKIDSGRPM